MKAAEAEVLPDRSETIQEAQAKPSPREDATPKRQPPYAVVLHNDDVNTFDHVVAVLRKVFQYDRMKAFRLTLQAHQAGRSIVWSGSLEVAELKADQIRSCGPDPSMMSRGAAAADKRGAVAAVKRKATRDTRRIIVTCVCHYPCCAEAHARGKQQADPRQVADRSQLLHV